MLQAAVRDGAGGVPRVEHRLDRVAELLLRVRGELLSRRVLIDGEEAADQRAELGGRQLWIGLDPRPSLGRGERRFEIATLDALDRLAEHLNEPAPGVEGKSLVLVTRSESACGLVVEAEVEDRVHHPGHRELGARANADEQRIAWIPEALVRLLLEVRQRSRDLAPEPGGQLALGGIERAACLGRDREAGRHGHAGLGHLSRARALASEQVAHLVTGAARTGRSIAEEIDPLVGGGHHRYKCGSGPGRSGRAVWPAQTPPNG